MARKCFVFVRRSWNPSHLRKMGWKNRPQTFIPFNAAKTPITHASFRSVFKKPRNLWMHWRFISKETCQPRFSWRTEISWLWATKCLLHNYDTVLANARWTHLFTHVWSNSPTRKRRMCISETQMYKKSGRLCLENDMVFLNHIFVCCVMIYSVN